MLTNLSNYEEQGTLLTIFQKIRELQKIAKTRDDYIHLLPGGGDFQENVGGSYKPPSVPTLLEEK